MLIERLTEIQTFDLGYLFLQVARQGMGVNHSSLGKTGDAFDEAFIREMIDHHQGAIDMAKLAKQNAKHDEIKSLVDNIVTAQTKEINEMKLWQNQWGYSSSSPS